MQPTLKTYNEIVTEVFSDYPLLTLRAITNNDEYANEWVYENRWELFDMPVDDELLFDYRLVEDIQDMASRYLESKNI